MADYPLSQQLSGQQLPRRIDSIDPSLLFDVPALASAPDVQPLLQQLFGAAPDASVGPVTSEGYTPDRSFGNIARDVLGTIGDALIMRDGGQPIYQPDRIQRKFSRALGDDFAANPLEAIRRLQQAGFGPQAQEMDARRIAQEQARVQMDANRALTQQRLAQAQKLNTVGLQQLSQLAGGIVDQKTLDAARDRWDNIMARFGVDESFALPPVYDEEIMESYRQQGLTPYQQGQLGLGSERVAATTRGQDIQAATTRRGQDISSETSRRGQDITATTSRGNNAQDAAVSTANSVRSAAARGRGRGRGNQRPALPDNPGVAVAPRGYTLPLADGTTAYISDGTKWIKQW